MTLYFERTGPSNAPTVLLLRPIAGTIALWGVFRDELSEHWSVVACEARGIACSPALESRGTTTRAMARDAADVLDRLGIARAHVVGLSLGGMVATWLAIDRPDVVDRLVLASTPARGLDLFRMGPRARRYVACLARGSGDREACLAERTLSPQFRRAHPDRVRQIVEQVRSDRGALRSLVAHAMAGALHDPRSHLHRIVAPTLCIAGARDDIVGRPQILSLVEQISGARFASIDAGHDLSLETPVEFADVVSRFLRAD